MLHALRLKRPAANGQHVIARADGTGLLGEDWWPYELLTEEFDASRSKYAAAWEAAVGAVKREKGKVTIGRDKLRNLESAIDDLTADFMKRYPPSEWTKAGYERWSQFKAAEAFLRDLNGQTRRIVQTGDSRAVRVPRFNPKEHGDGFIGLLTYMVRTGSEFAPAETGDEEFYYEAFKMMRDVYVEFAGDDESLQPKDLHELQQEKTGIPK